MNWSGLIFEKFWDVLLVGHDISRLSMRADLPKPMCCAKGEAPKDPPLLTVRKIERIPRPLFSTVIFIRAPIAARLVLTPTSLMLIQLLSFPGFSKTRKACASPGV